MKTYSDLIRLETFEERYDYLKLQGELGAKTFGHERYLNQSFYNSKEWKDIRREVILRDEANDLGHPDYPIYGRIRVHHINPISVQDFEEENLKHILDPEFLISVSFDTHSAIHFGVNYKPKIQLVERQRGDTCLWKVY